MDDDDVDGEMVMKTRTYKEWDHSADPCLRPISWRILVRESKKSGKWKSFCDGNQDVWGVFLENMRLPPPWTRRSKGEKVGRRKMRNKNFGMLSRKRSSLKKKWVKISRKVKCDSQKRNCVLFCGGTWDCPRWRRRVTSPQRSRALAWVDYFINNDYDHYDHDYQTSI